jgi:hypothetical protein
MVDGRENLAGIVLLTHRALYFVPFENQSMGSYDGKR